MFFQWGEVIGMRLEEMLMREKQNHDKVDASLNDPDKQNELVQQDEEEDFLDEGKPKISKKKIDRFSIIIYSLSQHQLTQTAIVVRQHCV